MADELQALLDKLNLEGVQKAEQKQQEILDKATREAEQLLDDAKLQAKKIVDNAKNEAELLTQKGQEALRQAARDILLTVRHDLQDKVHQAVVALLDQKLDDQSLAQVIATIVTAFVQQDGKTQDLQVLVNPQQLTALEAAVKAKLAETLQQHCTLAPAPGLAAGFKLVFSQNDVVYDFSDQALAEAVAAYVGPKITAALR